METVTPNESNELDYVPGHDRNTLIEEIVTLEWKMFSSVNNVGGPAQCQSQDETFEIMRRAQFRTWSEAALFLYRDDLKRARNEGRNLMTEKYARMMSVTHPEEYALIASQLPVLSQETLCLVDLIAAHHKRWDAEVAEKYPKLRAQGRRRDEDSQRGGGPSANTYLVGELLTYSLATLHQVLTDVETALNEGRNPVAEQLEETVKQYGWPDLATAETQQQ